ncbi:MAG TPA: TonB-dependent receptor [Chthoniobacterales bacterium]|jgi:outer membrane receptor protein involved in Fe transport
MINFEPARLGFFRKGIAVTTAMFLAMALSVIAQQAIPPATGTAPAVAAPAAGGVGPVPPTATGVDAQGNPVTTRTEAQAERVIVTGSNIPTAEEVGPNPVDTYNRESLQKSGQRTTEQFLLSLPTVNSNVVPLSNNENGSNTAVGAATISLRGFDARATLILIDGRRVAPYPFGNNPGLVNVMFVDLNSIPFAAIDSIEILKDGASTTYGADAVAGVVNIKLKHDYANGAEADVQYGNTLDKDSGEFLTSATFGVGNDTTNITGVMDYYHRNSIFNRDRGNSQRPPFLSSNASPYNLELSGAVAAAAGGVNLGPTEFAAAPHLTDGLAPASAYGYATHRLNHFNFNEFSSSLPESERWGLYLAGDHKVFGDQLVVYADGYYDNVKTHNELAAPATGSFQTKGQTTIAIPPHSPIAPGAEPPNTPTHLETGVPANAFNPFNPFEQIISGNTRARLAEFGNRLFDNETDAWLSTLGFKGDKLFDGTWGYDAGFRYSQLKNIQTGQQVSISKFNQILNAADPIFDPTSPNFIGTTTPFNPFGDFRRPIASNLQTVAFARVHPKDEDISKEATIDGTIYTTSLFPLPAGGVGLAVGGQWRRESLDENPDALNVAGDIAGNSPVPPAHGSRKTYNFFGEMRIPVFSPEFKVPGFYALEVTAAARFEEFLNNDSNVLVPKVGIRWQPFDEQLTVRSTWGEGYRQPSLEELFGSPVSTLEPSHDPKNGGVFEPETNTLIVSNSNLQPEDSRSFTAGIVYTPKYVPGLSMSVDFWDIERIGVVTAETADQVLQRELQGTLLPGESVERVAGKITRIIIPNENLGNQEARGFDFGVSYQKPTPWGTFTSVTQATYLDEFIFQGFNFAEFGLTNGNLAGRTLDPGTSNEGWYKWKGTSSLDWNWNHLDMIGTARYIDGFHEFTPNIHPHWVKSTLFFDVQASYDLTGLIPIETAPVPGYSKDAKSVARGKDGKPQESAKDQTASFAISPWQQLLKGTIITIGCNDVFGQDPPHAFGEGGNAVSYPGFTYDNVGRFVYGKITKKF